MSQPNPPDDSKNSSESPKKATDDLRSVLLADFAAMRSEITTLLSLQGHFLNMSVLLLSVSMTAATRKEIADYLKPYVPMGAIPFVILGLLYADCSARIMRAAGYINLKLRPEVVKLAGPCLAWEEYVRKSGRSKLMLLDYLRWTLFLVPACWFTWLGINQQQWLWAGVDLALIVFCFGVLLYVFKKLSRKVVGL